APPWDARFVQAGQNRQLQRVQVDTAVIDFERAFARLHTLVPQGRSERGVAFMLDGANQHGDGGMASIVRQVQQPGQSEADLLAAVEQESVARVRAKFGDGDITASTGARREAFRTSAALLDEPFVLA